MQHACRIIAIFVLSIASGFLSELASGEDQPSTPHYVEHQDLSYYLDSSGTKQPIQSVKDWEIRRQHLMSHLERVMGPVPKPERRVPLDVKVLNEITMGSFIRKKITYQSEPGDRVSAYLFLPQKASGLVQGERTAAILCLQQTTQIGKDEPAGLGGHPHLQYALHLAERGYVTLAPDYPSFGEHTWDFSPEKSGYVSGSMKAIWDNMRAVDLLQSLPTVDPQRIGCIGHSLGGHNALFTASFEPRIRVVVSSCGFTSLVKDDVPSWTGPRYLPRIATQFGNDVTRVPFDFTEIVAGLAPRPFLACAAVKDSDFDVTGVQDVLRAAKSIYQLSGHENQIRGYFPEGGHDFPDDARDVAYRFLDEFLKPAVKSP